jgi:general secretion pathway protein I
MERPEDEMPRLGDARTIRRRRARGFTLIEMVVSIILMAIGVVGAMMCIGTATRLTGTADDYATAAGLAQERLALVVSQLAQQPDQFAAGDQQGSFGDDHPGFTWRQQVETTDLPDLDRVTITISWPAGIGRREARFVTFERIPPATTSTSTSTSSTQ